MKKINWENSPSTKTPLSAENLNLMQENIEKAVNGVVLFRDIQGTTENITFSSPIEEGNTIEIHYARKRAADNSLVYKTTGQLDFINNMEVHLDINFRSTGEQSQMISRVIRITTNGITIGEENQFQSDRLAIAASNTIHILKVTKRIM